MQGGSTTHKKANYKTQSHMQGGSTAHKKANYKTQSHMQGGSTAQKAQTTKHRHTCKLGGTAQKAQTTKHRHTCKGGVQRKKHKLQNTVTHARKDYSAKSSCCTRIKNTKQGSQCSCCELLNLALKLRPDSTLSPYNV